MDPKNDFQTALDLFAEGKHRQASDLAASVAAEHGANDISSLVMGLCSAAERDSHGFMQTMNDRQTKFADGRDFCERVTHALLDMAHHDSIAFLEETFREVPALYFIFLYYVGCSRMVRGDMEGAFSCFSQFRMVVRQRVAEVDFIHNPTMNRLMRQGRLVAEPEEVARRLSADSPPAGFSPEVTFLGEPTPGRKAVIFTACNSLYLHSMGAAFVEALNGLPANLGVHIHVVSPDQQSLALAKTLSEARPGGVDFSVESAPPFETVTYYSCSRFFVLDRVLDFHGCAALSLDIDISVEDIGDRILNHCGDYDFCCFSTERNEPASVYQASIRYWAHNPRTHAFIDALKKFFWPELSNPTAVTWMLDQAALISTMHYFAKTGEAFRFGDLRQLTGKNIEEVMTSIVAEEVKQSVPIRLTHTPTTCSVSCRTAGKGSRCRNGDSIWQISDCAEVRTWV